MSLSLIKTREAVIVSRDAAATARLLALIWSAPPRLRAVNSCSRCARPWCRLTSFVRSRRAGSSSSRAVAHSSPASHYTTRQCRQQNIAKPHPLLQTPRAVELCRSMLKLLMRMRGGWLAPLISRFLGFAR